MKIGRIYVCCAAIPEGECDFTVYPRAREDEIRSVRNDRLKKEKYYAWRLLEAACISHGISFTEFDIKKTDNGAWVCDGFYFSLSHTDDAVAVAISDTPVGVDIEIVSDRAARIAKKVFSEDELGGAMTLSERERNLYTTRLWTMKESIFKSLSARAFSPQNIVIADHPVKTVDVEINGKDYVASVAGDGAEKAKFDIR